MQDQQASLADADLARRIIAARPGGARAEERELCARFERRARLYGLRHLRDEQAAADLAQRVLIVTLEKLRAREIRDPERIGSFILGTSRVVAQEMARSSRREAPLPDDIEDVPQPAIRPETSGSEHLARCLEVLGDRERAVLLMTFYEERSAAAIAEVVSTTQGNVRVIRHRAIARLRECMGMSEEDVP